MTQEVLNYLSIGIATAINICDIGYAVMVGSYVDQMTPAQRDELSRLIRDKVTGPHLRELELFFSDQTRELTLSGMCTYTFDRYFSVD